MGKNASRWSNWDHQGCLFNWMVTQDLLSVVPLSKCPVHLNVFVFTGGEDSPWSLILLCHHLNLKNKGRWRGKHFAVAPRPVVDFKATEIREFFFNIVGLNLGQHERVWRVASPGLQYPAQRLLGSMHDSLCLDPRVSYSGRVKTFFKIHINMMYITDLDKGHLILNSRRRLNWTRCLWPCNAEH